MKHNVPAAVGCLVLLWASIAAGGDGTALKPARAAASPPCCPPRVVVCPDDYCRKPMPRPPCPPCSTECDDYVRKPLPCVRRNCEERLCDDYCRKPLPDFCWPESSHVRCVPSEPSELRPLASNALRPATTASLPRVKASR